MRNHCGPGADLGGTPAARSRSSTALNYGTPSFARPRQRFVRSPPLATPSCQTCPPLVPDHDVIQHLDAQQLARCDRLLRDAQVSRRGGGIARGMVVRNEDGGGVGPHRLTEELRDPDAHAADRPLVDGADPNRLMLAIQQDDHEPLGFGPVEKPPAGGDRRLGASPGEAASPRRDGGCT